MVGLASLGSLAACVSAGPAAVLASALADAYTAFAPLVTLYRSYADALFAGADVAVPIGAASAAMHFSVALEKAARESASQSPSRVSSASERLVQLGQSAVAFDDQHREALAALGEAERLPLRAADQLAADGLFRDIRFLHVGFEEALQAAIDGIGDDRERWSFAVAFAMRVLLLDRDATGVPSDLRTILYGRDDVDKPPFPVPDDVAAAMAELLAHSAGELDDVQQAAARASAERIHAYVLELDAASDAGEAE